MIRGRFFVGSLRAKRLVSKGIDSHTAQGTGQTSLSAVTKLLPQTQQDDHRDQDHGDIGASQHFTPEAFAVQKTRDMHMPLYPGYFRLRCAWWALSLVEYASYDEFSPNRL